MRALPVSGRGWIIAVLAAGAGTAAIGVADALRGGATEIAGSAAFWLFLAVATAAHAFPVVAPRHQAYHTTQGYLLASVLLLPWPAVGSIVVVIHAVEWLRRRRPWYIQAYNVAVYLLSAFAAQQAFAVTAAGAALGDLRWWVGAVTAASAFLAVNHALTAAVLFLARGVSPRASGLFGVTSLGTDASLLLLGVPMAAGWLLSPASLLITSAPLILVYRALRLPGLEESAHRDRLTGLYNRRHFLEALHAEQRRAQQFGRSYGLVLAGVDDARTLVDRLGRPSLDFLLAALGERVEGSVRSFDVVARLGEDWFGVLLPEVDDSETARIARGLCEQAQTRPFTIPTAAHPTWLTLSSAWTCGRPGNDPSALLAELERSLERQRLTGPVSLPAPARDVPATSASTEAEPPRSRPEPAVRAPRWHASLPFFQGFVTASAVLLGALALQAGVADPVVLAAFVALAALSELLAFELFDRSSFSVNFAPILAAAALLGAPGVILATWTSAITRGLLRGSRPDKVAFNGSVFSLAGLAATLILQASGPLALANLPALMGFTVLASAAYYLHTFLVGAAVAMDMNVPLLPVWSRNFRWLFPHYLLLGLMGLALALATREMGLLGTAIFFAPPLMTRFVLKQYTDRTTTVVKRLEASNAELVRTAHLLRERGEHLAFLSDIGQVLVAARGPAALATQVADACVPQLGEACVVTWSEPPPGGVAIGAADAYRDVRARLTTHQPSIFVETAEALAVGNSVPLETGSGQWHAYPLGGGARRVGWLLTWCAEPDLHVHPRDLSADAARRVGLALENGALVEEAAAVDALRAINQAKTEFIAIAAHELRTPVTSLQGYAELLRTEVVDPELQARWLGILHEEAAQLGLLLEQVLDVTRIETPGYQAEKQSLDLSPLVHRTLEQFAVQARLGGHTLDADVVPDLAPVFADPVHVERALRNLLSNAIKYSPGGGRITLRAMAHGAREVELALSDEGLGIPKAWQGRLFARFQRVETPDRAAIRGTGLGLYITRQLVELQGGRLTVESAGERQGSTFRIVLPTADGVSSRHGRTRSQVPSPTPLGSGPGR